MTITMTTDGLAGVGSRAAPRLSDMAVADRTHNESGRRIFV
jgi:hypothetical protein